MNKRGFTLLEILLALTVMAGSIVVVASGWSGNFGRLRKAQVLNNVNLLLQKKLTELEAKNKNKAVDAIAAEEGDFGSDFPEYRWTFEVQPFVMPDISSIILKNAGTANDMLLSMMTQLQEVISKAMAEGKVTVFVKAGEKEFAYSVTTYFVDYNSEMNFGALGGSL
jgi:prepilin-type N-terminal cleavage/methylation domain-containing protein